MASKIGTLIVISSLVALGASAVDFGAHAGYYGNTVRRAYAGADVVIPFGMIAISPNLDYTRAHGEGLWFGNADVALRFNHGGPSFWVGAGPTYGYITSYGSRNSGGYRNVQPLVTYPPTNGGGGTRAMTFGNGSTRQWGWDANAGVDFGGALRPYVTARYNKVKSMKTTGIAVGVRFGR